MSPPPMGSEPGAEPFEKPLASFRLGVVTRRPELDALVERALTSLPVQRFRVPSDAWAGAPLDLLLIDEAAGEPSPGTTACAKEVVHLLASPDSPRAGIVLPGEGLSEHAFARNLEERVLAAWQLARARQEAAYHRIQAEESAIAKSIAEVQINRTERVLLASYTDLRSKNDELLLKNEELARANQLKDQFLANMSHELRTPLTGIIGWAEVLSDDVRKHVQSDLGLETLLLAAETIKQNGQSLQALISDLMDLARIEAGKVSLELQPASINDVAQSTVQLLSKALREKNLSIELKLDHSLPLLEIDRNRIKQVFWNLLSNAIKFTEPEGTITVRSWHDGAAIIVSFSDTGIGIPAHALQDIFDRFMQLDGSSTRKFGGIGIGLALVREFVRMHQGRVWAESKLGAGSTFYVALPVATGEAPRAVTRSRTDKLARFKGRTVLVVDDEPAVVSVTRVMLEKQGARVLTASNGQEALNQVALNPVDLILLDISLPLMDGFEVCRALRGNPEHASLPIVALTAFALNGDRERILGQGFNGYISKPFKNRELLAGVETWLESPKTESNSSAEGHAPASPQPR